MDIIPGSLEAIDKGCICQVDIDQDTGEEAYFISEHCPVHGDVVRQHKRNVLDQSIMDAGKAYTLIKEIENHLFRLNLLWVVVMICVLYVIFKKQ